MNNVLQTSIVFPLFSSSFTIVHINALLKMSLFFPVFFSLQVFLNTYGIQTQTPQQVEPIQIWAQQELVKVSDSASLLSPLCRY